MVNLNNMKTYSELNINQKINGKGFYELKDKKFNCVDSRACHLSYWTELSFPSIITSVYKTKIYNT